VRSREVGDFARYAQRLWRLKRRLGYLPFGPKLDAFSDVIAAADLLGYHLRCLVRAWEQAHVFRELFRQRIRVVRLEDLSRDPLEFIDSLLEFGGLEIDLGMRQEIVRELKSRKDAAPVPAWFQREFHDARFAPWRDRLDRAMRGL
jgi:hypothetical protein